MRYLLIIDFQLEYIERAAERKYLGSYARPLQLMTKNEMKKDLNTVTTQKSEQWNNQKEFLTQPFYQSWKGKFYIEKSMKYAFNHPAILQSQSTLIVIIGLIHDLI